MCFAELMGGSSSKKRQRNSSDRYLMQRSLAYREPNRPLRHGMPANARFGQVRQGMPANRRFDQVRQGMPANARFGQVRQEMPATPRSGQLPHNSHLILEDGLTEQDYVIYIERTDPATGRLFPKAFNPGTRNRVFLTASWINRMTNREYEAGKQHFIYMKELEGQTVDSNHFAASIITAMKTEDTDMQQRRFYHFCPGFRDYRGQPKPGFHAKGPCPQPAELPRFVHLFPVNQRRTQQFHNGPRPAAIRLGHGPRRAGEARLPTIAETNGPSTPGQRLRPPPIRRHTQRENPETNRPAGPARGRSGNTRREVGGIIRPPSPSSPGDSRERPRGV